MLQEILDKKFESLYKLNRNDSRGIGLPTVSTLSL
jgi:hypothetical protein